MTDNTTLSADWAIERAREEGVITHFHLADVKRYPRLYTTTIAFARYIEKHEQPPVDPWVRQARELASGVADGLGRMAFGISYAIGEYDKCTEVHDIAAALRAAYEKGKAE